MALGIQDEIYLHESQIEDKKASILCKIGVHNFTPDREFCLGCNDSPRFEDGGGMTAFVV